MGTPSASVFRALSIPASGLAIPDGQVRQANHACCVKPSLNGNSNSTASNNLNLRRIREQRLLSTVVAARILKLSVQLTTRHSVAQTHEHTIQRRRGKR
ncbi:hypothetical protein Tco_0053352 [Tanacetum coccineum]